MNIILNSNKTSLVQNTLTKESSQSLSYATEDSFPNVSKKISAVNPYITFSSGTIPDNNQITFNIPRNQIWYNGRLKFTYTYNLSTAEISNPIALNIIRQVDFLCNGQPFASYTGEAYKAIVMNSPPMFQEYTYRYAVPLQPGNEMTAQAGANQSWVSYLPLFGSWFSSIEKALNTSEIEQIQVVVTFKDYASSGLSASITSLSAILYTWKYMPAPEVYSKMVVKDFSSDLLMECTNTFTERFPITGAGTAALAPYQVTSTVFYPVFKTHVFIAKTDNLNGNLGCPIANIDSLSIDVGGENVFSSLSKSTIDYEQALHGMANTNLVYPTAATGAGSTNAIVINNTQIITIDWSLLCGRNFNSGLASMANLNKPIYSIYSTYTPNVAVTASNYGPPLVGTGADTWSNYSVFLVHEYFCVLSCDSNSRIISVRANQ